MKDLHLPLNQTQRVRCEKALHELQVLTPTTVLAAAVTIADTIPFNHEDSILRGHWTSDQKGKLVSTLCGVVEWVDKLVHVRTFQARLKFVLSNMMDLQSCNQWVKRMESLRGANCSVSPYLVKRQNQHCYHLEQYGVDLILGRNGFIWVGEHAVVGETAKLMGTELENFTPLETRNHVCRLANAVHVLSALGFTLTAELIVETAEASLSSKVAVNDMVGGEFFVQTAERERLHVEFIW